MRIRMKRKTNRPLVLAAATAFMLFLFPAPAPILCADRGERDSAAYRYDPKGKPDPFKPFIEVAEEDTRAVPLPPLRRFAVGEFRLIGIVRTADKKIAIVKTPEGKRYTLHRGTLLGVNGGRVVKIGPDSVIVVEKIKDFSGTVHTERVVLALKKNGGNP